MPLTKGFTRCNDPQEIQWRNQGETGGGHYEKQNQSKANREGGIMENEMPSLLLDEKYVS